MKVDEKCVESEVMESPRFAQLRVLARGVAMEEDHGPAGINPSDEPGFEGHPAAAREYVPLVGKANVERGLPIFRTRDLDAGEQGRNPFAKGEKLWARPVARRGKVGEGAGLPVRGDVQPHQP